jgi:DNA repair and recombination RAD54-like protein
MLQVLRQGIVPGGGPTVKKAIVVCPTSLVANWAKEIAKWVGDRIKPLAMAEVTREQVRTTQHTRYGRYPGGVMCVAYHQCVHLVQAIMDINTFLTARMYPVLIISYETFRIHAKRFHGREDACDLLICDEAHRLKNDATLTTMVCN